MGGATRSEIFIQHSSVSLDAFVLVVDVPDGWTTGDADYSGDAEDGHSF